MSIAQQMIRIVNPTDNVRYACHASHDMRFSAVISLTYVEKVEAQT